MIVRQYAPCSLGRSIICLGKQGEINALRVEFDVSAWMAMYPDATVKLMHFAPDRPQDNPVIPTLGIEGTTRVWIVGEDDTASAGNGVIELLLIDERTGSTIKSATGYTTVLHSPSAGIEAQEAEAGYVRYDIDQSALLTDEQKAIARKNIGAGTGDGTGSGTGGITVEKDPTVPEWAKQPSKPTYTASEVRARPDTWMPSASDVGADAAGTAAAQVVAHNVSGEAHADMRALIDGLTSRLNALADSDDTTLDQLSEIVAYIKSNKAMIDAVTTGKVSTSDIVDNLTTNASGKVLSAAQGVRLKALIDAIVIPDKLPNPQPLTINGQSYDGSAKVEVTVTGEGGGANINDTTPSSTTTYSSQKIESELNALNEANAAQDERLNTLENASGVVTIEPADGDIPKVFIDGNIPTTKTEVLAEMTYISKNKEFHAYLKIKCQGTSSMSYAKKNFTVKLYSDEARETEMPLVFRDWGVESSKYVLKANYIDHSHARNIVSANLWSEVVKSRADYDTLPAEMRNSPRNGAVDGFPIKVYNNGTYQGIYTWNIGKDAWMWSMEENNTNHILLCAETNTNGSGASTPCNFRALWSGSDGSDWSVEVGTNSTAVKDSLNALISCVKDTSDEEFKEQIGNHLDVQSAIDYYLHQYVICGLDGLAKNMLLATYDGTVWRCGAYDMDSTYGLVFTGSSFVSTEYRCPQDYQENNSLLFERLVSLYPEEMKARYNELRQTVYSLSNMFTHFERFMDIIGLDLYAEDLTIYTGIPSGSTNSITQIRNYIRDRLKYVDSMIPYLGQGDAVTGVLLSETDVTATADTFAQPNTAFFGVPIISINDLKQYTYLQDGTGTPLKGVSATDYSTVDTFPVTPYSTVFVNPNENSIKKVALYDDSENFIIIGSSGSNVIAPISNARGNYYKTDYRKARVNVVYANGGDVFAADVKPGVWNVLDASLVPEGTGDKLTGAIIEATTGNIVVMRVVGIAEGTGYYTAIETFDSSGTKIRRYLDDTSSMKVLNIADDCTHIGFKVKREIYSDGGHIEYFVIPSADDLVVSASDSYAPFELTATIKPETAENQSVTWSVDNSSIVEIEPNGLKCTVTPKSAGTAIVTCTAEDTTNGTITASCTVTVN